MAGRHLGSHPRAKISMTNVRPHGHGRKSVGGSRASADLKSPGSCPASERSATRAPALSDWRRQRVAGAFDALSPAKRGPKTAEPNPLAAELALSRRENLRLKQRLERAETIIELQKNRRGTQPPVGIETVVLYPGCGRERPSTFWWRVTP